MSGLTAYISEAAAGKKKTPQKWRRDVSSVDRIAVLKPSASAERQKQEYEAAQV